MTPEKAIACIDDVLSSTVNYDESLEYEMTSYDTDWLEEARDALELRIKKKPVELGKYNFICPSCEQELGVSKEDISIYDMTPPEHCDKCGQALDWGDAK